MSQSATPLALVHSNESYRYDWHALSPEQIAQYLLVDPRIGLTRQEVEARLKEFGSNCLPEAPHQVAWKRFLLQFHNPLIYVLLASGLMTLALADYVDAIVIFGVVVINACIGFVQEGKAQSALDAVRQMLAMHATVLREGERCQVDASTLVPGDVVLLESGDKVPADLRLIKAKNLRIEESALTGESVPVEKSVAPVAKDAATADRSCLAYSGTLVTAGQGQGIVIATGRQSEIGRIGSLVSELQTLVTPLTRRLDQLAWQITLFILGIGVSAFLYGYYVAEMPMLEIFLAVVGLAVAAIPEGLPAIVTIVLAIGTRTMAKNRAIVRRLPAVETLGSVSVICTDKTGTLTRNEMTVVRLFLENREVAVSGAGYAPTGGFHESGQLIDAAEDTEIFRLARCALLCNDASIRHEADAWRLTGDPTEGALITLALKAGLDPTESGRVCPRMDEIPFESERRFMATLHHDHEGHHFILIKGAPERVLELCSKQADGRTLDHGYWSRCIHRSAAAGERVLALAQCELGREQTQIDLHDITPRFELLGLVGIIDPPREEAINAIAECRRAGIEVKMITGDHAVTAAAIGAQLGLSAEDVLTGEMIAGMDDATLKQKLSETDVIARASPEHKLRLIAILQSEGQLVAMTGDGVNDAPALKAADIGVAMGGKGTDAASEASDIVLTDDNFATIERAVREGRIVFDNLKKSLLFLLPTDIGEGGVILLAIFAGLAMPVTAGQILWVNTVTAVTLALALAFEPGERNVMDHPPRPSAEPIVTPMLALRILFVAILMMAATFSVFEWELSRGSSIESARTAAVNMLVAGELIYLFNVRHFTTSAFTWETLTGNPVVLGVSAALIVFQLLFTYAAPMQELFLTRALDGASWLVIVAFAIAEFLAVEAEKAVWRRFKVVRI